MITTKNILLASYKRHARPSSSFHLMAGAPNIARTLRPKKSAQDHEAEKFNFDKEEFEIAPKQKLKVTSRGKSRSDQEKIKPPTCKDGSRDEFLSDFAEKTQKISNMILDISKHSLAKLDPNSCDDMLSDKLYDSFHKHMTKQETRMLEVDLAEGEAEAERLHLLCEKLDMLHWPTTLRKVTVMDDPQDDEELLKKRDLTQNLIRSMLEKFEAMKSRSIMAARGFKRNRIDPAKDISKIYSKIDRRLVINYHSSSDEEEEDVSPEEIRRHRRNKKQRQCRGSLIVQLASKPNTANLKYAIVAEPLKSPYVIKVSQAERKKWKMQSRSAPKKLECPFPTANPNATLIRKVKIPLTIKAQNSTASPDTVTSAAIECSKTPPEGDNLEITSQHKETLGHVEGEFVRKNNRIHSPPVRKKRRT